MGNHFTSTYPGSQFIDRLLLRAITPGGQVTVMNRDVTMREGGDVRRLQLPDRAALRALVNDHFGFDLPELETLRVPSIAEWA